MRRTMEAVALNVAANSATVRPHIGGEGEIDLRPLVSDPGNFCFVGEHGGFVLQCLSPGEYEVHTLTVPGAKRDLLEWVKDRLRYMFVRTDALRLVTRVPVYNEPARALALKAGFRDIFERANAFTRPTGETCAVRYMALDFDDWRGADETLAQDGEWFHSRLEEAKRQSGSALEVHDHDEAHERAVGAAVQMLRAGNPDKAVALYNRWAVFAGYAPIQLLSRNPLVIDVVDAVVEVSNGEMEVLLCR